MRKRRYARLMIIISIFSLIILLIFLNTREQDPVPAIKDSLQKKKNNTPTNSESRQIPLPPRPERDVLAYIEPTRFKQGIYWKIEKTGLKTSYLLGTMHVDDPRVLAVIKVIDPNFKKVDVLCTEIRKDFIAKAKIAAAMFYRGSNNLRRDLGENLYQKVKFAVNQIEGMKIPNIDKLKPWAVWALLSVPIPKTEVLDDRLHRNAILQRKKLCGLETVDEQLEVFTKTPLKDQIRMLEFAVDNLSLIKQQGQTLISLYEQRSLEKIYVLMKQSPMIDDAELINDYLYRLIVKRNIKMANSMLPYLSNGNAFFAVGALHLPGKTGILQLLESKGFTVTRLY